MKKQYYYIISSLPYLSLNDALPIRKNDFLSVCERHLEIYDYKIIRAINLFEVEQEKVPLDIIGSFFSWERGVRNALVRLRAEKLGFNPEEFLRREINDHSQILIAEEAFNADSPLLAEEILNKARWKYLDELEFGHYFDIERIAIFFLKLQILETISSFNEEKGRERLNAIVSQDTAEAD